MAGSAKPIADAVTADDRILPLPNLIEIQLESYEWFLKQGLRELFDSFSPIEDYTGNIALEFMDYTIAEPKLSLDECRERDATYEAPLYVKVRLVNKEVGEIKESEVYMGEIPTMTERGTFLINGAGGHQPARAVVRGLLPGQHRLLGAHAVLGPGDPQ
jgi:DNA-directed RNA polymerase beta subunit